MFKLRLQPLIPRVFGHVRNIHLQIHQVTNLAAAHYPEYIINPAANTYNMIWRQPLQNIYIVKKSWDRNVRDAMIEFVGFLNKEYPAMNVLVAEDVADELLHEMTLLSDKSPTKERVIYSGNNNHDRVVYTGPTETIASKADMVVTLGGDGTTLRAVLTFKDVTVPPILSFSMGTLGFLLPFDFNTHKETFEMVYESRAKVMNRSRLGCYIVPKEKSEKTKEDNPKNDKELAIMQKGLHEIAYAVNDISLHRGSEPHLISLDIFVDGEFLTTTTGDGVIFSSPTGLTAYSLSSGGSIVHPLVDCVMITPICPRSLSFRPVIVPANADIMLRLSIQNRNPAIQLNIDGINQRDVRPGDEIHVISPSKLVSEGTKVEENGNIGGIWCVTKDDNDWTRDINGLLGFNSSFLGTGRR